MWCKGKVQGNVVVLEEGVFLPDGIDVMVIAQHAEATAGGEMTPEELAQRRLLVVQLQAFGQRLTGRSVHLSDALLEGREELEARA
ncbi:MAG: hypothetical protein AB7N91_22460 [Candidatus Tectimicrobiota bacterium]